MSLQRLRFYRNHQCLQLSTMRVFYTRQPSAHLSQKLLALTLAYFQNESGRCKTHTVKSIGKRSWLCASIQLSNCCSGMQQCVVFKERLNKRTHGFSRNSYLGCISLGSKTLKQCRNITDRLSYFPAANSAWSAGPTFEISATAEVSHFSAHYVSLYK